MRYLLLIAAACSTSSTPDGLPATLHDVTMCQTGSNGSGYYCEDACATFQSTPLPYLGMCMPHPTSANAGTFAASDGTGDYNPVTGECQYFEYMGVHGCCVDANQSVPTGCIGSACSVRVVLDFVECAS